MSWWQIAAQVGAQLLGSYLTSEAARDAGDAAAEGSRGAIAESRRQFDTALGLQMPAINAGNAARDQLMALLGLAPAGVSAGGGRLAGGAYTLPEGGVLPNYGGRPGFFGEDVRRPPGAGGRTEYGRLPPAIRQQLGLDTGGAGASPERAAPQDPLDIIRNTPGYGFRLEEGARALNANRSAGGTSGGELLRDFARFNQGVASDFYTDYANRLAALAGTAQTASTNAGQFGVQTGGIIGNAMQNAGLARASGILGSNNAFATGITDIGTLLGNILSSEGGGNNPNEIGGGQGGNPFQGGLGNPQGVFGGIDIFSDSRLKENINWVGEYNGHNIYRWDWNDTAKELGVDSLPIGVIAQEVMQDNPDAVSMKDGYLAVDYGKL